MAYTFETVGQPTSPWPSAGRVAGAAARLLLFPVTAPVRWTLTLCRRVSVPPVSAEWLEEHRRRVREYR